MTQLRAHGISARLPRGVEGRIYRHAASHGDATYPVSHFATFAMPSDPADFGGGVVDLMRPTDVFVVLLEYGPESVGRTLFERQGMPRSLAAADFSTRKSRSGRVGHSAAQLFFVENGRPFTLYAVLGSHARRRFLLPIVNAILTEIRVEKVVP
ncbi:MAG: hypothetical protein QOD30_2254 [Actinomycetota bacterium]|nr:hypothetical protein [Actinomycetota bacterium]